MEYLGSSQLVPEQTIHMENPIQIEDLEETQQKLEQTLHKQLIERETFESKFQEQIDGLSSRFNRVSDKFDDLANIADSIKLLLLNMSKGQIITGEENGCVDDVIQTELLSFDANPLKAAALESEMSTDFAEQGNGGNDGLMEEEEHVDEEVKNCVGAFESDLDKENEIEIESKSMGVDEIGVCKVQNRRIAMDKEKFVTSADVIHTDKMFPPLTRRETDHWTRLPGSEAPTRKDGIGVLPTWKDAKDLTNCEYSHNPLNSLFSDVVNGVEKWGLSVESGSGVDLEENIVSNFKYNSESCLNSVGVYGDFKENPSECEVQEIVETAVEQRESNFIVAGRTKENGWVVELIQTDDEMMGVKENVDEKTMNYDGEVVSDFVEEKEMEVEYERIGVCEEENNRMVVEKNKSVHSPSIIYIKENSGKFVEEEVPLELVGTAQTNEDDATMMNGFDEVIPEDSPRDEFDELKLVTYLQEVKEAEDEIDKVHLKDNLLKGNTNGIILGNLEVVEKFIKKIEEESRKNSHTGLDMSSLEQSYRICMLMMREWVDDSHQLEIKEQTIFISVLTISNNEVDNLLARCSKVKVDSVLGRSKKEQDFGIRQSWEVAIATPRCILDRSGMWSVVHYRCKNIMLDEGILLSHEFGTVNKKSLLLQPHKMVAGTEYVEFLHAPRRVSNLDYINYIDLLESTKDIRTFDMVNLARAEDAAGERTIRVVTTLELKNTRINALDELNLEQQLQQAKTSASGSSLNGYNNRGNHGTGIALARNLDFCLAGGVNEGCASQGWELESSLEITTSMCFVGAEALTHMLQFNYTKFCHSNFDFFILLGVYKRWEVDPHEATNMWCWKNSIKAMRRWQIFCVALPCFEIDPWGQGSQKGSG